MRVVVPFGGDSPKTRLAPFFDADERREFALTMLRDVLDTVEAAGGDPVVLADAPVDVDEQRSSGSQTQSDDVDERSSSAHQTKSGDVAEGTSASNRTQSGDIEVSVIVDDRPLTEAVNDQLGGDDPIAIVMADLALATATALTRLFETAGDVVAAPGLGGGTNALVVRTPDFRVDYHGASIADHRAHAADIGASFTEVDSMRLAVDVDEPRDLVEVLLHGEGRSREWLRGAGVELDGGDGRVGVVRHRR